jgi:hypothetical protein
VADAVSWKVVERGWVVIDRYGDRVGTIERVIGDPIADIFDGVTVKTHHGVHYLPCEVVGTIAEGEVHLTIRGDDVPPRKDLRAR